MHDRDQRQHQQQRHQNTDDDNVHRIERTHVGIVGTRFANPEKRPQNRNRGLTERGSPRLVHSTRRRRARSSRRGRRAGARNFKKGI